MISDMIDELESLDVMASEQDNGRMEGRPFGGRLALCTGDNDNGWSGARVAGERYLGWDIDRAKHAADLRQALGGLKGPIMKVAQILSTIPDALPAEYADELAGLQADAPAMGWLFTKRRMASELGADWQQKFSQFEREAISAASLGQVHQAVGQNGEKLAVKLQYPDMQSAIEADLRQLKLLFQI